MNIVELNRIFTTNLLVAINYPIRPFLWVRNYHLNEIRQDQLGATHARPLKT